MIKKFKLFESRLSDKEIHDICLDHIHLLYPYEIHPDGSVSVNGNVNFYGKGLRSIPIKFKAVSGDFNCGNNKLTSLEGCPETVGGYFMCNDNYLTSLEGGPRKVGLSYYCNMNRLTDLKGCPEVIGETESIRCEYNKITSFDGLPEFWEGKLNIKNNPLDEVFRLFDRDIRSVEWIREYGVIEGDKVSDHRLMEVFHILDMEVPDDIQLKYYRLVP